MDRHRFGSTGRDVAVIGQGTWQIDSGGRRAAIAALKRGVDLGMTHIDTAEMYGAAEEIIAETLASRRDEIFLVSKVLPENASRNGTIAACEKSLRRLKTDRLDCYLLHWQGRHPLDETVAAFQKLRREGKILSWGVSNFDVEDLETLQKIVGEDRPACNQVLYHLAERAIEHRVIPWCEANGVAIVGYSPFAQRGGFPDLHTAGGRVLEEIADAHDATPRQVALRFLVRRPSVFAIPKASNPQHSAENARAGDIQLSEAELARIDNAFPLAERSVALPVL
ncbi:MAG TPA: aldo/keto reductase [Methylocella sp.]|nr:aldo/keto reductase [Methylocella sp.]